MADSQRKTANLFDEVYPNLSTTIRYKAINVGNGDFTLSSDIPDTNRTAQLFLLAGDVSSGASTANNGVYNGLSRTATSIDGYVTIAYVHYNGHADLTDYNVMLNSGSTPLPYEPYWQHTLRKLGTSTDTLTTLPADLYADGNNVTVGLMGNMSQTGTPTPTTPIQPQETGERTGNLFDGDNWYGTYKVSTGVYSGTVNNFYVIDCKPFKADDVGKTFTFRMKMTNVTSTNVRVRFTSEGVATNGNNLSADGYSSVSFTVSSTNDSVGIGYGGGGGNAITFSQIMLNTGSTALPYQPYGIKIPISSANTTTPVYLGEVQTTRKIGKIVLDGTIPLSPRGGEPTGVYFKSCADLGITPVAYEVVCSHFSKSNTNMIVNMADNAILLSTSNLYIRYTATNDINTWLASNPVTIWYVLATPTTAIVNEPLRKIGDYADTVSGITIPTTTGKDTFDVLTTLKPSEVSLAYTGWHDASVKEWDGSEWQ